MSPIARGFLGRRQPVEDASRIPRSHYVTRDFPVLSAVNTEPPCLTAWSDGGYTSNLALEDVTDGLTLTPDDEPGFWETYGYRNHGDPWLEQRHRGD